MPGSRTPRPWKGRSPERARAVIRADLKATSKAWGRRKRGVKRGGITNYKKELIEGLDPFWGGSASGDVSGDLMHFDMRQTPGLGQRINALRHRV